MGCGPESLSKPSHKHFLPMISKVPCICNVFTFLGNFHNMLFTDAVPSETSAGLQTMHVVL